MSKKFESVPVDVYQTIDLIGSKSGANRFAARIGEKFLACSLVDVDPGKKNFQP